MVPFNFNSGRSRHNGSSGTGTRTISGRDAGGMNRTSSSVAHDLGLSVLSMVREQKWCMGQFVLEGEFELEST